MTKVKKYPGQKKINGVYHKIINNIPAHAFYHELFAGSGAIAELLISNSLVSRSTLFFLSDSDLQVVKNLKEKFAGNNVYVHELEAVGQLKKMNHCTSKIDFVFLDPPYLHETRPNNTKLYKHEMTDEQHKDMLLSICELKSNVMIIHPKCNMYDTMLKGWRKIQIKIRYHGKTSIECLYMNYPKPRQLQTDIYLGDDCWDRQRILRKSIRWSERFKKLPAEERSFIFNKLKKLANDNTQF